MTIPTPPPFGGPTQPPFVDPFPGFDNITLPPEVQQEFIAGVMEGFRLEMEEAAQTTGLIEENFQGIADLSQGMIDETERAVQDVRRLRFDEDAKREAIAQMEDMGLSPEIIAAAVRVLAEQDHMLRPRTQVQTEDDEDPSDPIRQGVLEGMEQALEAERENAETEGRQSSVAGRDDDTAEAVQKGVVEGMREARKEGSADGTTAISSTADPQVPVGQGSFPEVDSAVWQSTARPGESQEVHLPGMDVASIPQPQAPYRDVIDSGDLTAEDRPSAGGLPAGRTGGGRGPSSTADEPMSYAEGLNLGRDFGSLREAAAERIGRWGSDRIASTRPPQLPDGRWVDPSAGAAWKTNQNRMGRLLGGLNAYGGGAGATGALAAASSTAAKFLGPVGVGVGAFQMAGQGLGKSRANNFDYQQAYGGGQADAYGQRLQETLFSRFDSFGTFTPGEGARLFRQVSMLGQEGEERDRSLDFATDMYREGVALDTSMRLISIAADEGAETMDGYAASLRMLGEVAEESGTSVKRAHDLYIEAIRETKGITSGESADELAAGVAALQTRQENLGMGKLDYAGLLQDDSVVARAAGAEGMTFGEMQAEIASGDMQAIGSVVDASVGRVLDSLNYGALTEEDQTAINDIWEASGGTLSAQDAVDIANIMMQAGVYNLREVQMRGRALGVTLTPAQWMQWIARHHVGDPGTDVTSQLESADEGREEQLLTSWDGTQSDSLTWSGTGPNWFAGNQKTAAAQRERWGLREDSWSWMDGNIIDGTETMAATDRYFEQIFEGERDVRSPALESVFQHLGKQEGEDADDVRERVSEWDSRQFEVVGEDGEVEATIGIADLPNYIDQLETGRVRTVSEDGQSAWLQDIVPGMTVSDTPLSQRSGGSLADTIEQLETTLRENGIKVDVEAKGDLADLIALKNNGGLDVTNSRNMGLPPNGFYTGITNPLLQGD